MARQTTPRGGLPFYAGGDIPAGMDQQKDLVQVLAAAAAFFDQGPYASLLPNGPLAAAATRRGYIYYAEDGAAWFWCDGTTWRLVASTAVAVDAPAKLSAGVFVGQGAVYRPDAGNAPSIRWALTWDGTRWLANGQQPAQRAPGSTFAQQVALTGDNQLKALTGPAFVVPFAGDWEFEVSSYFDKRSGSDQTSTGGVYLQPSTAAASLSPGEVPLFGVTGPVTYGGSPVAGCLRMSSVPVNATVRLYASGASGQLVGAIDPRISARPLRITPNA